MLHLLNTYADCQFAQLHAKQLFDIPEICVTAISKSVDCRAPPSCCLSFAGKVVHWVHHLPGVCRLWFAGLVNHCVRQSLGSSLTQGPLFTVFVACCALGGIVMSGSGSPHPCIAVACWGGLIMGVVMPALGFSCTRHAIVQFNL